MGLSYVFIAHDLAVVRHISDRVAVMYLGKIVELTDADSIYESPLHPYTRALLSAIPYPDPNKRGKKLELVGEIPSPLYPPNGCRFHTRCPFAESRCRLEEPKLKELAGKEGHLLACHLEGKV